MAKKSHPGQSVAVIAKTGAPRHLCAYPGGKFSTFPRKGENGRLPFIRFLLP
jgi:hypothetical protein